MPVKSAFNKEVVRSIAQSAGRFAAIAIISLLGAGVYAGLRMAAPDMRIAGDEYFDGTALYDVAVVTTLGLDDDSVATLRGIDGVGGVMAARKADAMVLVGENGYAASIESMPLDAAQASDTSDGVHAVSDDPDYLNRPILMEGAWPKAVDECVVGIDAAKEYGIEPGSTLIIQEQESASAADGDADGSEDGENESADNGDDVIGDDDSDDDDEPTFSKTELTVAGLVNAPAFASSSMLGPTTLGTGELELYLYVPDQAFNQDLPYTIVYLQAADATRAKWDSPAYDDAVASVKERVQAAAPAIGDARWKKIVDDAQGELDEARQEYLDERADAEAELDDAKAELTDAKGELDDAETELADAKAELDSGRKELDRGRKKLQDAHAELVAAQKQLAASKKKLDATKKQLDQAYDELQENHEQLEQMRQGIEAGLITDEQTIAQYEYASAAYEKGFARYDAGMKAYTAGVEKYQAGVDEYEKGKAEYEAGLAEYNAGVAKYEKGLREYEDGVAQYENGKAKYADGLSEYDDGVKEADEKFADAEKELADAQADIDDIEHPEVYVIDRAKNTGAASLSQDADGITQIALFLPFMFFLVAALVSLTSMTRMVDEERLVIGTHKALGFGKARITSKYLVYAALASGIGSVVGVVALGKLLPWFILVSYGISYAVPIYPTPIDPAIAARAIGLSMGVTVAATLGAAASTLREQPAALMLPRAPKAGKRIVLEKIGPLWRRMSFSHKVTARNLLRYKRRFFMAVVGIAGCTALLMVGFGLRDAIGGIVDNQYEQLVGYDAAVRLDDDAVSAVRKRVLAMAGEHGECLEVADFNLIAEGEGDDLRIEVVVPSEPARLAEFTTLRDRVTHEPLSPYGGAIVITEKAATTLGVSAGDSVTLYDENDVGDKTGAGRAFSVAGVAENYLGHSAYLLPDGYEAAFGEPPHYSLLLVNFQGEVDKGSFSKQLLELPGVNTVSFVADKIATYEGMLDVMNKLIYVIMLLSAALAFVVLYNLTNINITERVREIATLKVLGFTRGETNAYIFREVMMMSLIGALVGCVLGVPLTFYIARAAETANMMFGRTIEPASYALSFALTILFTVIVVFTMRRKLDHVNMVESLKSIE